MPGNSRARAGDSECCGTILKAMAVKVRHSAISIAWCSEVSSDSLKSKSCSDDS
jgi:hypothetical protein